VADVGDAVEDHGDALDAHAEGEAADLRGVVGGRRVPCATALLVTLAKTAGSTMPQPSSSIQPECLHLRQPLPPQKMQLIWTSALGSVKGKKLGKKRVLTPSRRAPSWRGRACP
jgi:hypothetical protein